MLMFVYIYFSIRCKIYKDYSIVIFTCAGEMVIYILGEYVSKHLHLLIFFYFSDVTFTCWLASICEMRVFAVLKTDRTISLTFA